MNSQPKLSDSDIENRLEALQQQLAEYEERYFVGRATPQYTSSAPAGITLEAPSRELTGAIILGFDLFKGSSSPFTISLKTWVKIVPCAG